MNRRKRAVAHVRADESIIEAARIRTEERCKSDPTYTLERAERDAEEAFEASIRTEIVST